MSASLNVERDDVMFSILILCSFSTISSLFITVPIFRSSSPTIISNSSICVIASNEESTVDKSV